MRVKPAILLFPFLIGFVSCQKEYSLENGDPPVATTGNLVKYTLKDDVSSLENNFEYNMSNRLIINRISAVAGSFSVSAQITATRNAANQITNAQLIIRSNVSAVGDTLNYTINRDAAGKISHYLLQPPNFTMDGYDSIVCIYNAANKLSTQNVYVVDPVGGFSEPIQRITFSFTGNNMVAYNDFELNGSLTAATLVEEALYEFDNNPGALSNNEDEFIIGLGLGYLGVNNPTKITRNYVNDPDENVITEYIYNYGTNGKPLTAEVNTIRPGLPILKAVATYIYQ